ARAEDRGRAFRTGRARSEEGDREGADFPPALAPGHPPQPARPLRRRGERLPPVSRKRPGQSRGAEQPGLVARSAEREGGGGRAPAPPRRGRVRAAARIARHPRGRLPQPGAKRPRQQSDRAIKESWGRRRSSPQGRAAGLKPEAVHPLEREAYPSMLQEL